MRRLFRLVGREPSAAEDVRAEMDAHLALKIDALVREGWDPAAAEAEARRRFGTRAPLERATAVAAAATRRRQRWTAGLDLWSSDFRQALRSLRRAPGFTVTAVLILALGIGASLAVLAVAERLLVAPLPFADPDRLVVLFEGMPNGNIRPVSYPTLRDWEAESPGIESMAYVPGTTVGWRRESGTETILSAFPTPNFFATLGARPQLGRTLTPADDAEGHRAAVLTDAFWRRRLGADPGIVGQTLVLTDGVVTVVGVMGPGFRVPAWADIYVPLSSAPATLREEIARRGNHADSQVIARLAAGTSVETAAAGMKVVAGRLADTYPDDLAGWTEVGVASLRSFLLDPASFGMRGLSSPARTMLLFLGAVALVLAIACANVACLTLVRGQSRRRELGVRSALGAGRGALIRRLMMESTMVAALGAGFGVALAGGLIALLQRRVPDILPRLGEVRIDPLMIALTVGLGALAAVASGLVPALRATPRSLADLVKSGARDTDTGGQIRVQRGLVVLQLGLAVTLAVAATLLVRSFVRVLDTPMGFTPDGLVTLTITPDHARYPTAASTIALYRHLSEEISRLPGVDGVAITNHIPGAGASYPTALVIDDNPSDDPSQRRVANFRTVSPEYFQVMGIPVVRGRVYGDADLSAPNDGLVVNQALADQYWPGQNPIGRRLTVFRSARWLPDFGTPITGAVIGVVGDVRHFGPEAAAPSEVYLPYTWNPWAWTGMVVRGRDPRRLIDPVWRAVSAVDPDLPAVSGANRNIGVFASIMAETRAPRRMVMQVAGAVALAALLLAIVGLYGVMAYQVGLRRRELGIRAALGAGHREILRLVMGEGLRLASAGIGLGLVGGFMAASLLRTLVFGVSVRDLASFAVVPVVLFAVAGVAVYRHARRASRVEPASVLKVD